MSPYRHYTPPPATRNPAPNVAMRVLRWIWARC